MNINLIVYPIILFAAQIFNKQNTAANRLKFIFFCSIVLLLKTSLRSVSVGSDTSHYAAYFLEMHYRSWNEIFDLFVNRYFVGGLLRGDDDMGYQLVSKIFSYFIDSFNAFTFIMQGLFFFIPVAKLLNRYCTNIKQIVLAYVLLNALFMGLPMANARQVYAIGLSILAFLYVIDRKYLKTTFCFLIAVTFHKSVLLAIVPIGLSFVPYVTLMKLMTFVSLFFAPVSLLFSGSVITAMGNFIASDKYAAYGHENATGGAETYIALSFLMAVFCIYVFWKKLGEEDKQFRLLYWMILLTITFCPLIHNNGSMIRITMYFQIYFVVILPLALKKFSTQANIYFNIAITVLIFLSLMSGGNYIFFWQENQNPYMYW